MKKNQVFNISGKDNNPMNVSHLTVEGRANFRSGLETSGLVSFQADANFFGNVHLRNSVSLPSGSTIVSVDTNQHEDIATTNYVKSLLGNIVMDDVIKTWNKLVENDFLENEDEFNERTKHLDSTQKFFEYISYIYSFSN